MAPFFRSRPRPLPSNTQGWEGREPPSPSTPACGAPCSASVRDVDVMHVHQGHAAQMCEPDTVVCHCSRTRLCHLLAGGPGNCFGDVCPGPARARSALTSARKPRRGQRGSWWKRQRVPRRPGAARGVRQHQEDVFRVPPWPNGQFGLPSVCVCGALQRLFSACGLAQQ